jgi:predicted Rdx family selenoprotein
LRELPEAAVSGRFGRPSSFEITVNGNLIFSKLECGYFPSTSSVIEHVHSIKTKMQRSMSRSRQASQSQQRQHHLPHPQTKRQNSQKPHK